MFPGMCNHYRTIPEKIADWAVWAGNKQESAQADIWPTREAVVARIEDGQIIPDVMRWGVPLVIPSRLRQTTIMPRHRSFLIKPDSRLLTCVKLVYYII